MRPAALVAFFALGASACGSSDADGATTEPADTSSVDSASSDGIAEAALDVGAPLDTDAPEPRCDFDAPRAPGAGVLFAKPLSATGADTLGGHGHDDGLGAVGVCPGTPIAGKPFYRLVAAGIELDVDVNMDGDQNDPLPVTFFRDATSFTGVGESGGRVNVYVNVVDETGRVLTRDTNPELRFTRTIHSGPTDSIAIDSKPASEFQTNFAMSGGRVRYGLAVEGASDRVINMRLPNNHHVTFVLVFRRELP